jgi:hypothetical protein
MTLSTVMIVAGVILDLSLAVVPKPSVWPILAFRASPASRRPKRTRKRSSAAA